MAVAHKKDDQRLLWGTTIGLFLVMLCGGGALIYWGRAPGPAAPVSVQTPQPLQAAAVFEEARLQARSGRPEAATIKAQVALSLERAHPSQPALEPGIRRLLASTQEAERDYAGALEQWRWLAARGGADEQEGLRRCGQALERARQADALAQLRGVQTLLAGGQEQRALAEARQAVRELQAHPGEPATLRLAHLTVARIALRRGNARLALEGLTSAEKLGALSAQEEALKHRLQAGETPPPAAAASLPSLTRATRPGRVPSLGSHASYPRGNTAPRPQAHRKVEVLVALPENPEPEEDVAPPTGARRPGARSSAPKVELPRLRLPGEQGRGSGSGYTGTSSDTLPTYQRSNTSNQNLPGY